MDLAERVGGLDWAALRGDLDRQGWATAALLGPEECGALDALWQAPSGFRKTVVMERHAFGQGLYKYWAYPLPAPIEALRRAFYDALSPIAEDWRRRLEAEGPAYPADYADYLARCRAVGQSHATPLLLRYEAGGYNCLHRDLYGSEMFPLQVAMLLSRPGIDFTGGEFVLVEQRPRAQSRPQVVPLEQGDLVVFAVNHRPVRGVRGWHRNVLRHGVSSLRSGARSTLGIILHDAAS